jgi:hypothetical protein
MKRSPASSSCLQRGGTNSPLAGLDGGAGNESMMQMKPAASVTILNTETLPTYSCERFYMLSEIEMNAPPVVFLSNLEQPEDEEDAATVDTETDERTATTAPATSAVLSSSLFPPCLILYILWRPTAEPDADSFVAQTLQTQVKRLQQHVDFCSFEEVASRILLRDTTTTTTTSTATSRATAKVEAAAQSEAKEDDQEANEGDDARRTTANGNTADDDVNTSSNSNNSNDKPKCSVYIVVDRICPGRCSTTTSTEGTDKVSEQLARAVATHETLRAIVQGITVGVSNHVRAAPGLEACHDAVSLGAKDRRQVLVPIAKSFLGLVADSPDDLLGLADSNECDAVQGVQQFKISAEYNGRGNLQSFAARAHGVWRQRHGLPPPPPSTVRRTPRRIRRTASAAAAAAMTARNSREMEFLIYDSIAVLLLILYVSFHSGHLLFPNRQE